MNNATHPSKDTETMSPEIANRFKYWQMRTILATMVGYALFYFVRKNFSLAMPGMEAELGITKTSLGLFLTLNGLIYGLSRFCHGFLADKYNARLLMVSGLLLCSLANLAFGFGSTVSSFLSGETSGAKFFSYLVLFMGTMWMLNGWLQGMGFPPCARLLTHWIPPKELATKMSVWNTSHSIGAGVVVILCGYIIGNSIIRADDHSILNPALHNVEGIFASFSQGMGFGAGAWKWCFWVPSGIAFLGAIALWFALRNTPTSVGLPELPGTERKSATKGDGDKAFIRRAVFGNPLIWILSVANFFVYIVRFAVLDWGPTLLSQSKGVSLSHAGWLVALFELSGIIGMLFAGWATDRFLAGRAHRSCVFCMLGSALFITLFWMLPHAAPIWMLFSTLCAAGFCIYGPQALIGIAAANQATKKAAATANGFTGLFGYASTIVSGVGFGYVAQHYGWNSAYIAMIALSVIGMGVFLLMWGAKAHGYEEENI
jgi:sugar phosphate permease